MIFRHDRASRGGGVLVAIRESIHVERLQVPDGIEILSLKLHLDKIFILSTVYVQPNSDLGHYQIVLNHFSGLLKLGHDWVISTCQILFGLLWSVLLVSHNIIAILFLIIILLSMLNPQHMSREIFLT